MPRGDGTGPAGMGPMTGWGRGFCIAHASGIRAGSFGGRLFGRGGGRGRRNMFYATGLPGWARSGTAYAPDMTGKEEAEMLKGEAAFLKEELEAIQKRLETLKKAKGSDK